MSSIEGTPDELQDAALRRALAHAPDQAATPDWRLRKAILKEAHDAVGAPDPFARETTPRPWWAALWRSKEGGRRASLPWNAAFATVLVATLVTVLWQREPIPGAGSSGDAQMKASPPRAKEPSPPQQSGSASPAAPAPAAPVEAPSSVPAAPVAPPRAEAKRQQAPREDRAAAATRENRGQQASPPAPAVPPPPPAFAAPAPLASRSPPAPTPPAAPQADTANRSVPQDAFAARSRKLEEESTARRQEFAARAPAAAAPGGAADAAPAASPSVRTEATEPPTFAALSQWSRITITQRGGESRSLTRAEARDLNALLGSAALAAVGPQPLAATPDWRLTLERNGETLAVFELARGQVRWREGRAPPGTGVPSAPALAALRDALRDAVQQPKPEEGRQPEAPRTP